jgi:hypothetical protein
MKLTLQRAHGTTDYTHGKLFIDGEYFCDTMEDQERESKVSGKTAIPMGHYRVIIDMSTRFKQLMPLILNVPNFTGVRIHSGNVAGKETYLKKIPIDTQKGVLYSEEYVEVWDDEKT